MYVKFVASHSGVRVISLATSSSIQTRSLSYVRFVANHLQIRVISLDMSLSIQTKSLRNVTYAVVFSVLNEVSKLTCLFTQARSHTDVIYAANPSVKELIFKKFEHYNILASSWDGSRMSGNTVGKKIPTVLPLTNV